MKDKWYPVRGFDGYEVTKSGVVRQLQVSGKHKRRVRVLEVDETGHYTLRKGDLVRRYSMDDLWALAGLSRDVYRGVK